MKFKKGNAGRPPGSKNKKTLRREENFELILKHLEDRITTEDFVNKLSPSRAAQMYVDLVNYIKPKLSSIQEKSEQKSEISINVKFDDEDLT